jgi:hypothetical protein
MTPELKTACELVFQEHKMAAAPINWTRDSFRGRLSFGMAALAKETLEKRNIICPRNPAKKTSTILNPAATAASNFEEAEEIILSTRSVVVADKEDNSRQYVAHRVITARNGYDKPAPEVTSVQTSLTGKKWWTSPLFCYIVLPVCAAIAGALLTYLLGLLI